LALAVPLSRFTPRVGGGSAFFVRRHYTFMNIRAFLLFLAGCCLLSAGCHREAAISGDSFRLTVERVITDHDIVVSLLKIHVLHNASISVGSEHSHCIVNLANSPEDAARDGQVALSGSRITRRGDDSAYIQTLIRTESSAGSAGGASINPVPAATTLDSFFSVSATSGDYKLDTPVEIGRLDGKPITLVVGKPER
jgi:hypothetical protein